MPVTVTLVLPSAVSAEDVVPLYEAVGWTAYLDDVDVLRRSLLGSHAIAVAFDDNADVVGLARIISDGATIAYLQDVLVHPDHQRTGLGAQLVETVMRTVPDVRQRVLLTDDEAGQRAFYEALGYTEAHDHEPPLRSFVRLA